MLESEKADPPAAGHDWLLPLDDPLVKLLGGDTARRILLDQATVRPGHRVLDIGCGTGTLAMLIKRLHPDVDVVGLDPDPKALTRAKRKAERSAVSIRLDQGFSHELPYPEASFDRVFSTFMFHHLMVDDREKTLYEVRRVLTPGGSLHMLDFVGTEASSHGPLARYFRLESSAERQLRGANFNSHESGWIHFVRESYGRSYVLWIVANRGPSGVCAHVGGSYRCTASGPSPA